MPALCGDGDAEHSATTGWRGVLREGPPPCNDGIEDGDFRDTEGAIREHERAHGLRRHTAGLYSAHGGDDRLRAMLWLTSSRKPSTEKDSACDRGGARAAGICMSCLGRKCMLSDPRAAMLEGLD